ncbi:MAG TPA: DUF3634 family protein [Verrucomicrobiae bacterium]|nr:DUF3634 family protein [Verrucomicrobiae bacterium]
MWLILTGCLAALIIAAVWFGFFPPPNALALLRFRDGVVFISKGQIKSYAKEDIAQILSAAGVTKCFIAIMASKRVIFSRHVPNTVHQRLRNVLLNQ